MILKRCGEEVKGMIDKEGRVTWVGATFIFLVVWLSYLAIKAVTASYPSPYEIVWVTLGAFAFSWLLYQGINKQGVLGLSLAGLLAGLSIVVLAADVLLNQEMTTSQALGFALMGGTGLLFTLMSGAYIVIVAFNLPNLPPDEEP